jgi:hypothetical protein
VLQRPSADRQRPSADEQHSDADVQRSSAAGVTKRARAERVYSTLSAAGAPVTGAQLAEAAGLSASYARALLARFHTHPPVPAQDNGHQPVPLALPGPGWPEPLDAAAEAAAATPETGS